MTNFPMIAEIDILQHGHSRDFSGCMDEQPACLFCVVAYHHELVIKLGENRFDAFSEAPVSPGQRPQVFLSIGNFQLDVCRLEKVLLHIGTQIPFVAEHEAVVYYHFTSSR